MRKKLLAVIAAAAMAVTMMPAMVFAVETTEEINGNSAETAVQDAVTNAGANPVTIEFTDDYSGNGVVVQNGQTVVFDLGGNTWDITGLVGSTGTVTNGMQLLKGSNVTIKNGKITSETAYILIQNYCNLKLTDVTLDGTDLNHQYTLSNNCGNVSIEGTTQITAPDGGFAFDVCYWPASYPEGTTVTINSEDVVIDGKIELGTNGTITNPEKNNTHLIINSGRINGAISKTEKASHANVTITGGDFSTDVRGFLPDNLVLLATYYDTASGDKEFHYWPVTESDALANATVCVDGIYYIDPIDAIEMIPGITDEEVEDSRIAYQVSFYAVTPTGLDTGENNTYLTIPIENGGIAAYLKASGEEIVAPAAVDGYKFIGWYAAANNNYEWTGDNGEQLKNFKYGEKIDMNARVTEDTEYFAAWEKIDAGEKPEKSPETGDESNMAVPFAAAGLALAAMAAVVAARRRHN